MYSFSVYTRRYVYWLQEWIQGWVEGQESDSDDKSGSLGFEEEETAIVNMLYLLLFLSFYVIAYLLGKTTGGHL